ncbi:hypothetical protein ANCDUO_19031, partial [Ancylostoma duodenale]
GVSANVDGSSTKKHEKFVPLVAFECGYRNKYMHEDGVWVSDENRYATCLSGKLDILKYCKKHVPAPRTHTTQRVNAVGLVCEAGCVEDATSSAATAALEVE